MYTGALSSVRVITLGKVSIPGHRYSFFAECRGPGTRQRDTLCRVPQRALGKEDDKGTHWRILCRVSPNTLGRRCLRHSSAVTAAFLCRLLFDTRQSLCRVPEKKYSAKKALPIYCLPSPLCRVQHSAKHVPSVFQTLPSASGDKEVDSGSEE
jgi:hypothetical protein